MIEVVGAKVVESGQPVRTAVDAVQDLRPFSLGSLFRYSLQQGRTLPLLPIEVAKETWTHVENSNRGKESNAVITAATPLISSGSRVTSSGATSGVVEDPDAIVLARIPENIIVRTDGNRDSLCKLLFGRDPNKNSERPVFYCETLNREGRLQVVPVTVERVQAFNLSWDLLIDRLYRATRPLDSLLDSWAKFA